MSVAPEFEIVRWFTRARKFPQLIGRTPDGAKIPGGPYTVTQAVGAGLILVVGLNTMGLWARFGLLGNLLALAAVTWLAVWLLGRIPVGSRSPLSVTSGLVRAVAAPAAGRLGGRPVRIRRPRVLRHQVVIGLTPSHTEAIVKIPAGDIPDREATRSRVVSSNPVQSSEDIPAVQAGNGPANSLVDALAGAQRGGDAGPASPGSPRPLVLSGLQTLLAATTAGAPRTRAAAADLSPSLPTTSNSTEAPR